MVSDIVNRRAFIKLLSSLPFTYFTPKIAANIPKDNVLIIVFDAFSALNNSIYGYGRNTMPLTSKHLEKATIFHRHYTNGTFTSPGTASLFTGTHPWTHRVFNLKQTIVPDYVGKNMFRSFSDHGYHGVAYSHNPYVNNFFDQFSSDINTYIPQFQFFLHKSWPEKMFSKDLGIALLSYRQIITNLDGPGNSIFLTRPNQYFSDLRDKKLFDQYQELFPGGLPEVNPKRYFLLETGINWLIENVQTFSKPFMGYFHFFPPHDPYRTRNDFYNVYKNDGFSPARKPEHLLSEDKMGEQDVLRKSYDESIRYVDAEFSRLLDFFESSGVTRNTWVIFTSDHGEMFERGIVGHLSPPLYEPLTRVPLIIFAPGQEKRLDIYQTTNTIDLLPTLLHVTGHELPAWVEGEVLPPYRQTPFPQDRSVFSVFARRNPRFEPITSAVVSHVKWPWKLIAYWGLKSLKDGPVSELYNLEEDPDELSDMSKREPGVVNQLLDEIHDRVDQADRPYR